MSTYLKKKLLVKGLKVALFSLILPAFFIFTAAVPGNSSEPSAPAAVFQLALVDEMADFPVQWVAAGGGVLAYGARQHAYFAPEETPNAIISSLSFDGNISAALILGTHAYLLQDGLGLRTLDLSDPSRPTDMGYIALPGQAFHLANWGNLLLIGEDDHGVQLLEPLSSAHPMASMGSRMTFVERGFIPTGEPILAMTVSSEGKAYVATSGGIRVYDVSDPSRAVQIDDFPITVPVSAMAVNGDYLYIAAGAEGLHVIDLSIWQKDKTVAIHPIPSDSIYLAGRQIYVAGDSGLHVLQAGPIATATFDVQIVSFQFIPATVNIVAGDTVRWTWMAGGHSTTSGTNCTPDNLWDAGVRSSGFTFTHTFNAAGTFPYFCIPHCTFMTGTVNVSAPPSGINLLINPTSLQFGSVTVNDFGDLTVLITNQPGSAGTLTGEVKDLAPPFTVTKGLGAFSLAPGASTDITVRFLPTATGPFSGTLSITHNATNTSSPTNIPVNGLGVTSIVNLLINPPSLDFASVTVGQQADHTVTVTNQSNSTGTLTGSVGGPSAPFSLVSGGGVFSLSPGASTTIVVRFSPGTTGVFNDTLTITHNGTNQNSPTNLPLVGTGVTTPVPDLVVSSLSGPTTAKPGNRIMIVNTVQNQGTGPGTKVIVNFFLSTDPQITPGDIFIGKRSISRLPAGATDGPVSTRVTIPKTVATGTYYLGAIVTDHAAAGSNTITLCLSLSKPKLLSPKNRGTNISTSPTLTWSAVNGASTYEVQVATDSGFTNIVASPTGLTDTQWAVTPSLTGGTTFFWRVRAVNLCGPGPFSATSSFKTAP